jgi:AcrR family transcriptional regulator
MVRTRSLDYDSKRRSILHRSAELFARFGYSGTSITMIAKACGVSKALLYHYYPDKEAVLFDLLCAHLKLLVTSIEKAVAVDMDPRSRVHTIATTLLDAYRDADAEHQVQISNLKLLPQEKQEQLLAMERTLVDHLSDALAAALPVIGRGPLLKPLTMSVFGMLNWHYLWFRDGKGVSREEYGHFITNLIFSGAEHAAGAVGRSKAFSTPITPSPINLRHKTASKIDAKLKNVSKSAEKNQSGSR